MTVSKAKKESNMKYNKKAYDRIGILVKKPFKDQIAQYAKDHGKTVNSFILELIAKETGLIEIIPNQKGTTE